MSEELTLEEFLVYIKNNQIPPDSSFAYKDWYFSMESTLSLFEARQECNKKGMWAIVDKKWTCELAKWIGKRKCLEVMAGAGWLSKALLECDIDIIATDNFSWDKQHTNLTPLCEIEKIDAVEAVRKYKDRDVLIVSWPPYDDSTICDVCKLWKNKPIIYIGEGDGGCNAPENFWNNFKEIENQPKINFPQWYTLHDSIYIGKYEEVEKINNALEYIEI
jgi:hypothetical protein